MIEPARHYCPKCRMTFDLVNTLSADGQITTCAEGCGLRFQHGAVKRGALNLGRINVRVARSDLVAQRRKARVVRRNPFSEASPT